MKYLLAVLMGYGSTAYSLNYEASKVTSKSGHEINVMRMSGLIEDREGLHWMVEVPNLDPQLDTLFVLDSPGGNVPMGIFLIRKVEEFLNAQAQAGRKTWIVVE